MYGIGITSLSPHGIAGSFRSTSANYLLQSGFGTITKAHEPHTHSHFTLTVVQFATSVSDSCYYSLHSNYITTPRLTAKLMVRLTAYSYGQVGGLSLICQRPPPAPFPKFPEKGTKEEDVSGGIIFTHFNLISTSFPFPFLLQRSLQH